MTKRISYGDNELYFRKWELEPKDGIMDSIFNYNTLDVSIHSPTKSMMIKLNRSDGNAINLEMIFELETLFNWLSRHLEVQSVCLTGEGDVFTSGLDHGEIENMSDEKFKKMLARMQKFSYFLFFLPQTIIVDFKSHAMGIGMELTAGADIRLAKKDIIIKMDYLNQGFVPVCGGIGLLGEVIPKHYLRSWFMSGQPLRAKELDKSGFIQEFYDDRPSLEKHLNSIANQAPVPRIQCKRSLLESVLPEINRALDYEKAIAFAGMHLGDWRQYLKANETGASPEYTSAKTFAETFKYHDEDHLEN